MRKRMAPEYICNLINWPFNSSVIREINDITKREVYRRVCQPISSQVRSVVEWGMTHPFKLIVLEMK